MKGIINGFCTFEKARFVHRDLKPENILILFPDIPNAEINLKKPPSLIANRAVIKIGDLGFMKELSKPGDEKKVTAEIGTPYYMAPEAHD